MKKDVISDWHGTIAEDEGTTPFFKHIGLEVVWDMIPGTKNYMRNNSFSPQKLLELYRTRNKLKRDVKKYEKMQDNNEFEKRYEHLRGMFSTYNEKVIEGLPVDFVEESTSRFADKQIKDGKLDKRILNPVKLAHDKGSFTGILSSGYEGEIEKTLLLTEYFNAFDLVMANGLSSEDGKSKGFELDILENKGKELEKVIKNNNIDEKNLAYIGNALDDEPCFQIAKFPVIAPYVLQKKESLERKGKKEEAKPYKDFIEKCASKYDARVPASQEDVEKIIGV